MKESGIGLSEPEGSSTPQEDEESHLTWNHEGSQSLGHPPGSIQELDFRYVQLCLRVGPLTSGMEVVLVSVPCNWIPFLYMDCLSGRQCTYSC